VRARRGWYRLRQLVAAARMAARAGDPAAPRHSPLRHARERGPLRPREWWGGGGRGVLIRGTQGGNGVLVWLRSGDSLAPGDFPLLERADTVAARGAVVAVRYMLGDVAHGFWADSGAVSVDRRADRLTITARGSGLELGAAGRTSLVASFGSITLGSDTVSCQVRP